MRSTFDRIRQALSFEILGLLLVTPLGALVFDHPIWEIGVLAIVGSLAATGWNYVFNLGFDHLMLRLRGTPRKTVPWRVVHAVAFETGLVLALLPFFAWWLGVGLWEAAIVDLSMSLFYLVYAFVFTWAYEAIYPLPE